MQSRRNAIIKIAAATVSAAVSPLLKGVPEDAAIHHVHDLLEPTSPSGPPKFFNQSDYQTLAKLVDLIIPRTETPGASDAAVPHRIDFRVAQDPKLQEQFNAGLKYLAEQSHTVDGVEFSALSEAQQTGILEGIADNPFFTTVKDMTIDAYYSSEQGLVQELGFKGNTFRSSFPGCTHPEHWPAEEKH